MSLSEPAATSVLSFTDVSAVRGGRLIWAQATFTVPAGSVVAVLGPNGSGKTTLLHMILGLVPTAGGRVEVFGRTPGRMSDSIGYVPQHYAEGSGDAIRAFDAVLLGLTGNRWAFGRSTAAQRNQVREALAAVEATGIADRRLSTLSGGQRQRVAIAAALVAHPQLLVLDEPLAAVDIRSQRDIVTLLARLHAELEVTIAMVAHNLNPLLPILDSAIYLLDGQPRYAPIDEVVDAALLTRLYGTPIQVIHTNDGDTFLRGAL